MDRALTEVLVRRERLLARAERERTAIASTYRRLAAPAAAIDRIVAIGWFLRSHPVAVAGGVAGIMVLRARSVGKLAARGLGLWRLLRRARTLASILGL